MIDLNTTIIDNLKTWLATRKAPEAEERIKISAPENLRSIGFPDLQLPKYSQELNETVVQSIDYTNQKPKSWTEFSHLLNWSSIFVQSLEKNKDGLATLELLRGANEIPITLAKHRVDECIRVVEKAVCLDVGLAIQHPDSRSEMYAVDNILIEDQTCLHDILRQTFACLYSKCLVRLVVKSNSFYPASIATYIVDLMHSCGATPSEVNCYGFDKREALGVEHFSKPYPANKTSRLSTVAVVFKDTDTFAAAQGIVDAYYREQYSNSIVLVEESVYEKFIKDWQRYYSFALYIGPRLEERTVVVDSVNENVKIDLTAIDIKASHKMAGQVINILRFRSAGELLTMLNSLRKIPYLSIWNDDSMLAREFCLKINQCSEFWINHIPKSLAGRKFPEDIMNYYNDVVSEDMVYVYNLVYSQFSEDAEQLRKLAVTFSKKSECLRKKLIMSAFISILEKCKSLRLTTTVQDAVARLMRSQHGSSHHLSMPGDGESQMEVIYKPVGLAIIYVREECNSKSKAVLVELIFKNLLVGNAVLLACPQGTLGAKFAVQNDHIVPFKMVYESLPDISRLSLTMDPSMESSEVSMSKKQCPKNTYAIEFTAEMNEESCEAIVFALGTRRKIIFAPDVDQTNYWVDA